MGSRRSCFTNITENNVYTSIYFRYSNIYKKKCYYWFASESDRYLIYLTHPTFWTCHNTQLRHCIQQRHGIRFTALEMIYILFNKVAFAVWVSPGHLTFPSPDWNPNSFTHVVLFWLKFAQRTVNCRLVLANKTNYCYFRNTVSSPHVLSM